MRALHWAMAALILANLTLAWLMTPYAEDKPWVDELYYLHKSLGITLLGLIVLRVLVRRAAQVPPLAAGLPLVERRLAHSAHRTLYLLMLLVPLLGYLESSAYVGGAGVPWFGLNLPQLVADDERVFDVANWLHRTLGYTLLAVIALHVAGVVKHRYFDKPEHDSLRRML